MTKRRIGVELHPVLRAAIESYPRHLYELASRVPMSPSVLSAWRKTRWLPARDDRRVRRLGRILGLRPDQLFADDAPTPQQSSGDGPQPPTRAA